jgi:hypothetical protein
LARRAVLPASEEPPGIRRSYAALMLAVFSLTGVVAVPGAVSQVAGYVVAPPGFPLDSLPMRVMFLQNLLIA